MTSRSTTVKSMGARQVLLSIVALHGHIPQIVSLVQLHLPYNNNNIIQFNTPTEDVQGHRQI